MFIMFPQSLQPQLMEAKQGQIDENKIMKLKNR